MPINVDSTIHVADVMPADHAAARLGVKRQTLYAYASRGLLTRVPLGRGGASGYLRADVERLKARSEARAGHRAVAAGALLWGEPVLDTEIGSIGERGPIYRGTSAVDLAGAGIGFERAAELLWTGTLPERSPAWPLRPWPVAAQRALRAARAATPLARLTMATAWMAAFGGESEASTVEETLGHARAIVARLADVVSAPPSSVRRRGRADAPTTIAARLARMAAPQRRTESARDAVDRALVLIADHELNASTFAARIAASAGATLESCLGAALATISGSRHGGECARVEAMLASPGSARAAVSRFVGSGRRPPGFGHPLYPSGDPRASELLEVSRALDQRAIRRVDALVTAVHDATELQPTVDLALVALQTALGAAPGFAGALFAVGRCAGWIAHVLEQRRSENVLRPRARYVGRPRGGAQRD